MAQSVKYSILTGPAGYIIVDLDTAKVLSGDDRKAAAASLRDAINAEFPDDDWIANPSGIRLIAPDGTVIKEFDDSSTTAVS